MWNLATPIGKLPRENFREAVARWGEFVCKLVDEPTSCPTCLNISATWPWTAILDYPTTPWTLTLGWKSRSLAGRPVLAWGLPPIWWAGHFWLQWSLWVSSSLFLGRQLLRAAGTRKLPDHSSFQPLASHGASRAPTGQASRSSLGTM